MTAAARDGRQTCVYDAYYTRLEPLSDDGTARRGIRDDEIGRRGHVVVSIRVVKNRKKKKTITCKIKCNTFVLYYGSTIKCIVLHFHILSTLLVYIVSHHHFVRCVKRFRIFISFVFKKRQCFSISFEDLKVFLTV